MKVADVAGGHGPWQQLDVCRQISIDGGLTPAKIERIWGHSPKAQGLASRGFGASLWESSRSGSVERTRPSCIETHVVSVWTRGSATSELHLDGKLRFKQARRRGTFQLARAGEELRVVLSQSSGNCLDVYVPAAALVEIVETEFERARVNLELLQLKLESDHVITRLADEVALELQTPSVGTRAAMDGAMLSLGVCLVRRWSNLSGNLRLPSTGLTQAQVRKTIDLLNDALHVDIPLNDLAAQVGLSTYHFARAFKASVGVPPHRYQIGLRLVRARKLLETTVSSVDEIARQVGYEDASYFTRAFKREFAISPGAYRRHRQTSGK